MDSSNRVDIPNKIPAGVPGAGWVLTLLVVFSFIMLTADIEGWSFGGHQVAAPAAPPTHHTMAAGAHS